MFTLLLSLYVYFNVMFIGVYVHLGLQDCAQHGDGIVPLHLSALARHEDGELDVNKREIVQEAQDIDDLRRLSVLGVGCTGNREGLQYIIYIITKQTI